MVTECSLEKDRHRQCVILCHPAQDGSSFLTVDRWDGTVCEAPGCDAGFGTNMQRLYSAHAA